MERFDQRSAMKEYCVKRSTCPKQLKEGRVCFGLRTLPVDGGKGGRCVVTGM